MMYESIFSFQLKAIRESRKCAVAGGLLGAAHLGGVSLKYSKSPHGNVLQAFITIPADKNFYQHFIFDNQFTCIPDMPLVS